MSDVAAQTLHIVARELNVELNDARAALENFGEQQDDVRFLENSRERLHHVHGALRVAEVHGAALLAEEMEQVASYLINNFAEKRHLAEGLDALMRAMVQLPTYLDRVLGGGRDMALILLPLLNDLRAVRGNALLSEGTLLVLNLSSERQANPQAPAPGEPVVPVANWARKLRTRFQLGLLGWIKGERVEQNLDALARTAEKMEQVATTQSVFQLWWVVGAVIEALRDGALEGSASIKRLLGQADREMRRLYEIGEQQYAARPPVELLNNLLYYVARAGGDGPRVKAVRTSFKLDELLPVDSHVEAARESLAAPSAKLMKTVAGAIKEDLAHVKDAFDIFVRQTTAQQDGGVSAAQLAPQLDLLRKIGDTLGVLGLGALRDKVQTEITDLRALIEKPGSNLRLDETRLMRIASTLINIEDSLDEQLIGLIFPGEQAAATIVERPDIEFRQVSEAVLRECIVNMARIKETIAFSVERPREPQVLHQLPELIGGIAAGLKMLGKSRAMEVTEKIAGVMTRNIRADGTLTSRESMDRMADAIVAMDYYLETLQAGRSDPWYMLDNAEACLQALDEIASGTASIMLPDFGDHAETIASDQGATVTLERAERTQVMSTVQQMTQVIPSQAKQQASNASQATATTGSSANLRPPLVALEAGKADAEFVELFIEEARDVFSNLQHSFPLWDENPNDQESLTQIRRSFHTLKGSGRVVGALAIGELAWSVESLLNRVINRTLDRTPEMMIVLRETMAALPQMIEQLESGRATSIDVADLIVRANQISQVRENQTRGPSASESDAGVSASTLKKTAPSDSATKPSPAASNQSQSGQPQSAQAQSASQAANNHVARGPQQTTSTSSSSSTTKAQAAALLAAQPMDSALRDIFSKETAGHLQAIREYIGSCAVLAAPYPVTEALHRACHTLRGAAKTAGARHGIKISEPLNRYIRKLCDNGVGLPPAGLQLLRDAVRAMEMVVEHINESTGYFVTHQSIIDRIAKLEAQLDGELTHLGESIDASAVTPAPELQYDLPSEDLTIEPPTITVGDDVIELSFDAAGESPELGLGTGRGPSSSNETLVLTKPKLPNTLAMQVTGGAGVENGETAEVELIDIANLSAKSAHDDDGEMMEISIPDLHEHISMTGPADAAVTDSVSRLTSSLNSNESIVIESIDMSTMPVAGMNAPVQSPQRGGVANNANAFRQDDVGSQTSRYPQLQTASKEDTVIAARPALAVHGHLHVSNADDLESTNIAAPTISFDDIESSNIATLSGPLGDNIGVGKIVVESIEIGADDLGAMGSGAHPAMSAQSLAAASSAAQADAAPDIEMELQPDDFDADIAAIFSEEASELLEVADTAMSSWSRDLANKAALFELKRAVHTLKGGARMAGIRSMGNLSHEYESFVERIESGTVTANDAVISALQACLDELHRMRDAVNSGQQAAPARALIARLHALAGLAPVREVTGVAPAPAVKTPVKISVPPVVQPPSFAPAPTLAEPTQSELTQELAQSGSTQFGSNAAAQSDIAIHVDEQELEMDLGSDGKPDLEVEYSSEDFAVDLSDEAPIDHLPDAETPAPDAESNYVDIDLAAAPMALPGREQAREERQQEVARVDADLLDSLLNNAGEVSILRSRVEQQINSVEYNLQELNRTVTRLKEQMRNLELETEAQILHRHQEDKAGREDFDPLELDRYSQIQQLSRALSESVSDVASIEGLLESMTREAQNLLLQQSRVVSEVQNGLMRTRMVPFQRHVQRLSRIVRQVAGETHKRADLVVSGASGEMDRQVLERMLPPFEHMLRNSVVHGIESPDERIAAGKADTGTIKIALHREGSEMVIVVEDDGRGIDVNAVRERAIARGLLKPGRSLTDEEALQLVLEPGFSTASSVTQHAGRGVGMDVVVAEIKKLGGALFTQSTHGQGVRFTIRLPFTLAIAQSLLVRVGEEQYALPLPTIEGVARIPRTELIAHLRSDRASFHYGDQKYRIQYLGAFIGATASVLPDADLPIPVILIRAGEHSAGLVVDELLGNREIVVKPVGPQVAGVRGVAGATILGDGRIVIILDMGALVRSEWRHRNEVAAPAEDRRAFAMVVDDSITVRRVTQRLLERNGMRVMTAKDGIDALEILQDHMPDVILLDIEMPRMDGYEFATRVRADARLAEIPIIMITSRVGDKHRAHAMEIGVNEYLGKPYQENELLDTIEPLIDARRNGAAKGRAVH